MTKMNLEAAARAGSVAHMIRGGRLVKRKGQVLSFAPHVGQLCSVSCGALAAGLALGVSLLGAAPASAGTCDPLAPPNNQYTGAIVTCSGPADAAIDVTQEIVGQQLTVTTAPGFGIFTSTGDGLSLAVGSGYSSGLTFVDTNAIASQITAAETAIDAYAVGRSSITTNATIKGGTYGVKFAVGSVGSLTITATGSVEGTTYDGINAALTGEARDMTVRAADVTGGRTGIDVVNKAYGSTFVGSSNSVTAINGIGIIVNNENPRTENLTVDVVNVSGKAGGIEVGNNGTGATSVSSSGEVYSSNGDGISAYNDASATDITIIANDVDAKNTGILARNLGKGNTRIDSISYIKAGGDGISATNEIDAGDLTITAVKVEAGDDGIVASNFGKGATSVTATGDIVGAFSGINVANAVNAVTYTSNTTDLTVNAVNVTGGEYGIIASNQGNGETYIKSTGSVSANSATGTGISVSSGQFTTGLTIKANDVNGGKDGIDADHSGRGNLTITTDGLVQGLDGFGIDAYNGSAGSDLTILANGDVSALLDGISVYNNGIGNTSVTAFGTVEAGNVGISALNGLDAFDLKVSANIVTASGDFGIGIFAYNTGKGSTSVTATGAITANGDSYNGIYGDSGRGIYVFNSSTAENLEIIALDTVTGGDTGITAKNNGSGSTSITASGLVTGNGINSGGGAGTGASGDGIYAYNAPSAGALTVSAIDVTADKNGISVFNKGTGATTVSATGVVTGGVHGIYAKSDGTATGLTIDANIVNGGEDGIVASNTGRGATFVSASGAVNGTTGFGIYAKNITSGTDLTIDVETDVTGGTTGIFAVNNGTGVTLINTTGPNLLGGGTVTGEAGNGIDVLNEVGATHLIVEVANVTGATNGIKAVSKGNGSYTSITATGTVKGTGANSDGINALSGTGTDYLKIVTNSVEGVDDGIDAKNDGAGFTLITAIGNVEGKGTRDGIGISAVNAGTASSLEIKANNANTVQAGGIGISAQNLGNGATAVSSTGNVIGAFFDGINAVNSGTTLTIDVNSVTGGEDGIDAQNDGDGFALITANGLVTGGAGGNGINVINAASATALTVDAAAVTGGLNGIFAENLGTGVTVVTATGLVGGTAVDGFTTADGIRVTNTNAGNTDIPAGQTATPLIGMQVSAHDVNGGVNGIFADHNGAGGLVITADGIVNGRSADGINANNSTAGTYLSVTTAAVTGGAYGIFAQNLGTGATFISASGAVSGGTGFGIYAQNGDYAQNIAGGTDLTIDVEAGVSGGTSGIFAVNYGTGSTSITTSGLVEGEAENGIYALNGETATDLTIIAEGDVTGLERGIFASNDGSGVLSITAIGDVVGTNDDGIRATANSNPTGVTVGANVIVDAANVTGGSNGIFVSNRGDAATSISASGTVKGTSGYGIDVSNGSDATDLTVIANIVTGGVSGIVAENEGAGFTSIITNGLVTGGDNGIKAVNDASTTDLTVSAAAVTGGVDGIFALNDGTGVTIITATGLVGGTAADGYTTADGIHVTNSALGNTAIPTGQTVAPIIGMQVSAHDVNGGVNGIFADHNGAGGLVITADGSVNGRSADGINANNSTLGTYLSVTTATVTGGVNGIFAKNDGTGATLVSASGAVTGRTADGIHAANAGTNLTVSAAAVAGGVNGIYAVHNGTGNTVVTASGSVNGATGVGIVATALNTNGGELRITAKSASGLLGGIVAQNDGAGASTVSVTGTIAGGDGAGIETSTLAGNLTTVNLATTAIIGATSGKAIANNDGNSILNVSANAVINGTVELDGGTDTASFARNGTLATISLLDGGDNVASADGSVDTLNLNGVDDFNLVGANTVNWEVININGGTIGFSDARILAETINVNNRATLNGANSLVATANVNIAEGAALTAGNAGGTAATRITGNLVNAGLLNLSGSTAVGRAGDTLSVAGNYTGVAAQVRLDTVLNGDNSPTDLLNVAGNVTGSSLLTVNNAGGIGGLTTGDGIRIVQVGGASAQDGFVLLDELKAGAFRYDLFLGGVTDPNDQDWYLRTVGLSDVAATTLSFARLSDDIAMTFLGTLHERVGEQEHLAKRGYQSGGVSGIWGRFVGKGFREKLTSPTLGDVKSTGSITGLQMGLDFVRNIKGDGSATFAGVYSGYADGNASDKNIFQGVARRSGTSDSKGWLTGLYGTHYSSAGWYANVVLQANWVDASANGRDGTVLKTDGRTYLGSVELGQSLKLVDRLAFEPQVQLIYGDTQFDAATDSSGIENRVGIESSLIGRAGFRLKTTKSEKYNAEGGLFSGYLKANLWHNLSGADVELFSAGQPVGGFEPKKTWVDVGLGTTLTVAKNTEIYFDADVEFGLDIKNTAGRGNVGLRFNW